MSHWRWLAASALCGYALSCSNAPPDAPTGSEHENIIAGEPSPADQDGVVLLRAVQEDTSELLCTASLVAPNLILTARHCVAHISDGDFSCSPRGDLSDNPTGAGELGLTVSPENLEVYAGKAPRKSPVARGQQVVSTLTPNVCKDDLAFVVLDTALDLPVIPMRLGRPAQLHELAVLVGYGIRADRQLIDYQTQPRQQKRGLEVAGVGPALDADATTLPPRSLLTEGPSGCQGDSGGPLLAESSGALLGVYSLGSAISCSAVNVRSQLVHVPFFQPLIDEAFAAAGDEPVPEPTPEPTLSAGGANAGGAGDAPDSVAGDADTEPHAAAGAAGDTPSKPETNPKPRTRSGCSLVLQRGESAETVSVFAWFALAALGRRRKPGGSSPRA
jgi:Trypsin